MNGELHQLLLITALGNGFLIAGSDSAHPELEQHESLKIQFKNNHRSCGWREWLQEIRQQGGERIMLVSSSEPHSYWQTSGFAGGGRPIGVVVLGTGVNRVWTPSWQFDQRGSRQLWNVTYTEKELQTGSMDSRQFIPLEVCSSRLHQVLQGIGELADAIEESFWREKFFEPGLNILKGILPVPKMSFDLPAIYSEQASRMLNAAYKSWVFGGMGSWNDSPPYSAYQHQKEKEYEELTSQLYEALLGCVQSAVNSVIFQTG
ncbi:hypothetical protein Q5741_15190 [Paenibacillus sp. JX-17]|uniref:Uncharacterized protein n=1 Tax=Paenibacillus lacisoli TaxID=3064525 RepID=A0ABT9CER2_9BACL|nr:hypothetical protein [Paenibacillus sp. JX-17]MDO7907755.1 hypothetical protein [Paenibacillus sp. JX-17]